MFRPDGPLLDVLRRRPPGLELPDTVGVLMARSFGARIDRRPTGEAGAKAPVVDRYLLYLPPGFGRGEGRWPLLLYLHGRSLRGDDLERVKRYGIPRWIERGWDLPFVVVAPQLPAGEHWIGEHVDRVMEILQWVAGRHPVDDDRIYLTGFSMGAGGVWQVLGRHAGTFAAAVPISAWTPPPSETWAEELEDLPLLVYHGTEDEAAPYARAVAMVRALRKGGVDIRLVTLEGAGHGIVNDVYGDATLYRWLLRRERG